MQLKSIILLVIMAVVGFVSTVTATADDANLCTPSVNQYTCVLTFQTKFGDTPNQGRVAIYSPSCNEWGEQVLTSSNPTSILAWGLSIKQPVLFVPVAYPGLGYASPKFEYGGKIYGPSNCSCHVNPANGSHDCVCCFDCVPFQLDSKAEVDAEAEAETEVAMAI